MQVKEDVIESLHLRDPLVLISSFDRPNIHYSVSYYAADASRTFEAHAISTILRHFEDGREHSANGEWYGSLLHANAALA